MVMVHTILGSHVAEFCARAYSPGSHDLIFFTFYGLKVKF